MLMLPYSKIIKPFVAGMALQKIVLIKNGVDAESYLGPPQSTFID